MIKTVEQILYEEIRHVMSCNYLVPKQLSEIQLRTFLEILKADK